ncbi:ABC transporter ATP-binding protein [Marinomonas sp. SBI22]|uniref:ABC transporter substrate-binding protein n=1 Tax=unclassified Marinomonas TaxID=196814 RepID=UPI0007BC6101|nr:MULTISPECIES: ABC transporter substrate-binding protein [unclassified Marinomonas]KZM44992.1 ABC transporter ATP-binding protein [Marinomonas sp. SBI22]KZM46691.1 ABC transporter ATP-binding protein [Marinomonas sp. SBI8L]
MTMLKKLNALIAGSLLSLSVQAQESIDVMLDWFVNPDHAALIIAEQKGLFKDQGLKVNLQEPADPSMPPKLVAAGKVDFAVTYQPELIQDVAHGLPLTRISTLIATPLNTLMVLKDGDINSLADLKGKSIGTAISGGVSEATIGVMLENSGLSLSDVSVINVGWALSSSLASKKVDAIYGGYRNFEMHQLAMEGFEGKAFFVEEEGVPPYDELVVVANSRSVNKTQVAKFNRALELATQYIVNHPNEAWELFKSYKKDLDTKLNQLAWKDTLARLALRPAAYDANRYQSYAEFLQSAGIISKLPNTNDYLF